jgi:DNA-binding response OmpR family regulator
MKHILLIEDERDHAALIGRTLAEAVASYRISHVDNLAEGRTVVSHGLPDLALVDCRLPDGNGDEFVAWAAGRFPVILLTAFGNERTAVEAIKAGALDYIIKSPETFADMAHLVERALREWTNVRERQQAESRLEAINHLLATMGPNFVENASRLITLLAREIGAQFAFYSQVGGARLCAVAEWHVEKHLSGCVTCNCAACAEALNYAAGQLRHVSVAQANPLADPITLCAADRHPVPLFQPVLPSQRRRPPAAGHLCRRAGWRRKPQAHRRRITRQRRTLPANRADGQRRHLGH